MKIMVMIPTYNEKENIARLINDILNINNKIEIVVVDDYSPDGTWKIVKNTKNKRVHLLLRKKNRGRGLAGIAGFKYCLDHKADVVIEMDGDFSHEPKYIPTLISRIKECDVVLGSRNIKGGKDSRGFIRRVVSKLAAFYIRAMLGYKIKDPTSGYRCFKSNVLKSIKLDSITATDPFVVTEVLYRCHKKGYKICEVPITFVERKKGKSKLGFKILLRNLIKIAGLRFGF